ncbi:hypothetical protein ACEN2D_02390 [Corynebacterium auriscanis]|uniref:hypothetical protein n=1 Tax=Corynebacterium auriscanis TaxID=99807 RepID=UPI003CF0EADF
MEHKDWLNDLLRGDSMRQASHKVGYAQTTLQRQADRGSLSPEMVIALCRAYDHPAVEGLVETGYLFPHEVETPGVNLVLPKATNRQLLEEINRRSDPEARHLFTATDDHDVVDLDEDAEVFEFAPPTTPAVEQRPYDNGMPDDAVADSSPEVGGTLDDYET